MLKVNALFQQGSKSRSSPLEYKQAGSSICGHEKIGRAKLPERQNEAFIMVVFSVI